MPEACTTEEAASATGQRDSATADASRHEDHLQTEHTEQPAACVEADHLETEDAIATAKVMGSLTVEEANGLGSLKPHGWVPVADALEIGTWQRCREVCSPAPQPWLVRRWCLTKR